MHSSEDLLERMIYGRRSIRNYTAQEPPASWIEAMVACAARAPSPSNSQPVRFLRIVSPDLREKLLQAMINRHRELVLEVDGKGAPKRLKNLINVCFRYSEFMFSAPVIMMVGTVMNTCGFAGRLRQAEVLGDDSRGETDLHITVGLALMNFLLKGQSLGLGTCILTAPMVFLPDVEKISGIEDVRIKCFVTVGFPDEVPSHVERKALSEIYREL